MQIGAYLDEVRSKHLSGQATEHSYRPALETLFRSIDSKLEVINEPKRVRVGAPDFVFNRNYVSIGWAEAKDLDKDIRKLKEYSKDQQERYRKALPNLIYTNGIDFEFLRQAEVVHFVSIADFLPSLPAKPEKFDELARNLKAFAHQNPVTIQTSSQLASFMAGKAAMIKDVMSNILTKDSSLKSPLASQFKAFKADLLPNLTPDEFADIYAETVTYGMFAGRLHDETVDTFSRSEALELLPRSNPFLRSLFSYIAGPELDDRIAWIIDDLAHMLRASDPDILFKEFKDRKPGQDPFIHFYEDFLKEYNPKKRKSRGVWYTPKPVVDFIVGAVDQTIKKDFGLSDGLADTSRVIVDHDTGMHDKRGRPLIVKQESHRVQILDPATGTGTFLASCLDLINGRVKAKAPGQWSSYVEDELIPRVHGFELLMASYTMCHLKMDLVLKQTGYKPTEKPPRFSVWLTDALEAGEREARDLFFTALAEEARGANDVKRNKTIMCVIGNPPYFGESVNKGDWILELLNAYKKEPGGKSKLQEKNSKWLNDDYVKFMRLAENYIERAGEGVLGFITNHGYLDNPTFLGMRWHLLKTFNKIYVLDLHGSSKKHEVAPDNQVDKNVFDIQQGVAIIICVKKASHLKSAAGLAQLFHSEFWGSREEKNARLSQGFSKVDWTPLAPATPWYNFTPWEHDKAAIYEAGFSTKEFFPVGGTGVVTKRDELTIHEKRQDTWQAVQDVLFFPEAAIRKKYNIPADVRDWKYEWAKKDAAKQPSIEKVQTISYRPFDDRFIYYTGNARGFVGWPVAGLMHNFIKKDNIGLATARSNKNAVADHFFITKNIMETKYAESSTQSCVFPLYVYPQEGEIKSERKPNFDVKMYASLKEMCTTDGSDSPEAIDVFDYIYAVLHCPDYREKYSDFLKNDFPRIPWPVSGKQFWKLQIKGEQLRLLHLLEESAVGETPFPFEGAGDSIVRKIVFDGGKVWINETQFFDSVPETAWNHSIGGYKPAYKWLKDRRGLKLDWQRIGHYQKVVKVLSETSRIMKTITLDL